MNIKFWSKRPQTAAPEATEQPKWKCPECMKEMMFRSRKRHLMNWHGYQYTQASPSEPVKVKEKI
jgi:hypothetical protein